MATMAGKRRGFSLIELMVVIGIIILLIGILIPALAGAKKSAQKTDTMAEMSQLQSAIDLYQTMFSAYPGPVRDADIAANNTFFSGNQNLLVAIGRRWMANSHPQIAGFKNLIAKGDKGQIVYGTGMNAANAITVDPFPPPSLNDYSINYAAGGKSYSPLITLKATDTYVYPSEAACGLAKVSTGPRAIPVIVDRFASRLPILYYRRSSGVDRINPLSNATPQAYYANTNLAFTNQASLAAADGTLVPPLAKPPANNAWSEDVQERDFREWFQSNPTVTDPNQTVARGGYVLISAGADRHYGKVKGTTDDIVISGGQ